MFNFNKHNVSALIKIHDLSYGGYRYKVECKVACDAAKIKALKGTYGSFVLDFNNWFYHATGSTVGLHPTLDYSKRASKGVKTMVVTYFFNDAVQAKLLGYNPDGYASLVKLGDTEQEA